MVVGQGTVTLGALGHQKLSSEMHAAQGACLQEPMCLHATQRSGTSMDEPNLE